MSFTEHFTVPYDRGKFFHTDKQNFLEVWRLQRDKTAYFNAALDTIDILDSFSSQISVMDNGVADSDRRPGFIAIPHVLLNTARPNHYRKQPTMLGGFEKDPQPPICLTSIVQRSVDANGEQIDIRSGKDWYMHVNPNGSKSYGYRTDFYGTPTSQFEVTVDDKAKTMSILYESTSDFEVSPHA